MAGRGHTPRTPDSEAAATEAAAAGLTQKQRLRGRRARPDSEAAAADMRSGFFATIGPSVRRAQRPSRRGLPRRPAAAARCADGRPVVAPHSAREAGRAGLTTPADRHGDSPSRGGLPSHWTDSGRPSWHGLGRLRLSPGPVWGRAGHGHPVGPGGRRRRPRRAASAQPQRRCPGPARAARLH
jgi:hypothetical protein